MTTEPLDAPLFDDTDPSLARPLQPALVGARADVVAAARDLLAIPEAALTRPWAWIGGSEEEVRYGAYRAAEALEQAEIEARTRHGRRRSRPNAARRGSSARRPPRAGTCTGCCSRSTTRSSTPTRGEGSGRSAS